MDAVFRQFFDWGVIQRHLPDLLWGYWVTIQIALLSFAIALTLGLLLALMSRPKPARNQLDGYRRLLGRAYARAYINVFRGLPALLILLLMDATFPRLNIPIISSMSSFQIAILALGLVYAAYVAEVYRAGIDSIDHGQHEAARSLGMSRRQTMRLVILPQAVRRVLPPLLNDFIALLKDTALVGVLALGDVIGVARDAQSFESNGSPLVGAAIIYLLTTLPLIWLLERTIRREAKRTGRGDAAMQP